ncbi:hypothetical protein [Leptospira borgpetersenii]|nr:hypothetical protein [Leptospira borgpetersenii]
MQVKSLTLADTFEKPAFLILLIATQLVWALYKDRVDFTTTL